MKLFVQEWFCSLYLCVRDSRTIMITEQIVNYNGRKTDNTVSHSAF